MLEYAGWSVTGGCAGCRAREPGGPWRGAVPCSARPATLAPPPAAAAQTAQAANKLLV